MFWWIISICNVYQNKIIFSEEILGSHDSWVGSGVSTDSETLAHHIFLFSHVLCVRNGMLSEVTRTSYLLGSSRQYMYLGKGGNW